MERPKDTIRIVLGIITLVVIFCSSPLTITLTSAQTIAAPQANTNNETMTLDNKGNALYNLGKNNESITYYDKALAINPNDTIALNNKGNALVRLSENHTRPVAYDYYNRPSSPNSIYTYIWTYKDASMNRFVQYDEGLTDYYHKMLFLDPNATNVLLRAITLYDKALSIDPKNIVVLNNKGIALIRLGKYAEAISYFDKSLSKDPNSVGALYNKGKALDDLGRHTEAIDNYNRAHSIDPRYSGQLFNKLLTAEGKSQSTYRSAL